MVGPTCRSLIWTMLNPSKAGGRSGRHTSTVTTPAVRRAFRKPMNVTARPRSGTAIAEPVRSPFSGAAAGTNKPRSHTSRSSASRSTVNTSSDENSPMNNRPAAASVSAAGGRMNRRASRPVGTNNAEMTSSSASSAAAGPAKAGTMRAAM